MQDVAHVYRDLRKAIIRLEEADSDAEFLAAQAQFEQIESEWMRLGETLGLGTTDGC